MTASTLKLARKARAGDIEAGYAMGCYLLGEGSRLDCPGGLSFLRGPAEAGHQNARLLTMAALVWGMNDVGGDFSSWVIGLPMRFWFGPTPQWLVDEAAAEGNALRVIVALLQMAKGDAGVKINTYGTLVNYAMEGSPPAMAAVGYCNMCGHGTTQNFEQAYVCYSVAHTLGMNSVVIDLSRAAEKLSPDRLIYAQARASETFTNTAERALAQASNRRTTP